MFARSQKVRNQQALALADATTKCKIYTCTFVCSFHVAVIQPCNVYLRIQLSEQTNMNLYTNIDTNLLFPFISENFSFLSFYCARGKHFFTFFIFPVKNCCNIFSTRMKIHDVSSSMKVTKNNNKHF